MPFVKVADVKDIAEGSGKVVEANGKPIALFKVDGNIHAIDNTCLHRGGPLGEGSLDANAVTCPLHGWRFDVTNGQCLTIPTMKVQSYAVKVEGNDVLVDA